MKNFNFEDWLLQNIFYIEIVNKGSKNTTWNTFLNKAFILAGKKYRVFEAVSRSTQTYNDQLKKQSHIEKVYNLQRYFQKRLLKLSNSAPS